MSDEDDEDISNEPGAPPSKACGSSPRGPISTIYAMRVAPNGSDTNTKATAYATLTCALTAAGKVARSVRQVTITVNAGDYAGEHSTWSPTPGSPSLTIQAADRSRPHFDGNGSGTWLKITADYGQPTPVTVSGMEITNYQGAISVNGQPTPGRWNGGIKIINNRFANIGSQKKGQKPATAAIRFVNSRNNLVQGNAFVNIRNAERCVNLHSIYMAHFSSGNRITGNTFDGGCGDPIKVRNQSNSNTVTANVFRNQKTGDIFVDAYCNADVKTNCTSKTPECPSYGNIFANNKYIRTAGEAVPAPTRAKFAHAPRQCGSVAGNRGRLQQSGWSVVAQ